MTVNFRQLAVSGGTAALLLGGAATVTLAAPAPASAATQTAVVHAVTAPVTLPDGRTMRITGMGGYGHQATEAHVATVAAYRTGSSPTADPNLGTGLTPDGGVGAAITNPVNGQQTGVNQQIVTQSSGGYIGVGVVTILLLAIIVFFRVKHKHLHVGDAVIGALLGLALSGTVFATMGHQLTNSVVGSISSMLGSLG